MFGVAMEAGPKQALSPESAAAIAFFDQFVNAQTFKGVLGTFRLLCDSLRIKPTNFPNFYPKLKAKLRSWKANALWAKIEKRANHKCYNRGKACANTRLLIIGAGPCGLRTAIEAQLLGAKVVIIEKRDRLSRNNVLHLWPFVIHDLRNLGAKKFYGKFCVGAIDHISIRQLQCVLLKVALLIGVEVHENVSFDDLIEPPLDQSQEKIGWKPLITPRDHPVSQYEFDVLIGADGKRNTLKSFKRKEFRGKLAIAITANFINRHSEAEARVQEISGVAFIFNQKFFQDLKEHTGIDLENIVYYKDETHYFVMTAKKYSLIEKGVIFNDYADTAKLLAPDNVSREALLEYAREAAEFSTNFQMPNLEFAVNHYGQADVAMFDFTSMFAAESASRVVERRGHKLLQALVGDSLLEPFWPTGSGCARGFLSSLDACWMIRSWSLGCMTPFQVLAQRESIYRLLAQTTPENLSKDYNDYTIDPTTRYPNLNLNAVLPVQVKGLYDTDGDLKDEPLEIILPKKKRKRDSHIHPDTLLSWCQRQVILYRNVSIENMTISWRNGLALCAIIHRYRPDLIDFNSLQEDDAEKNNQLAFDVCEREFGILPIMTGKEMAESNVPDALAIVSYISQIYDNFRGEIPYIVRAPLTDLSPEERPPSPSRKSPSGRFSFFSRLGQRLGSRKRYSVEKMDQELDKEKLEALKRAKKKRSLERDRALFILNKESVQPTLTSYKKNEEPTIEDRENFNSRVKDLEEKLYGTGQKFVPSPSSAPKVGKIGRGDWNVKMLEERLKGSKPTVKKERVEVPKWSRDIFQDKLRAMNQKPRSDSPEEPAKFTDFDSRLHMLDKKLKEGNNLEIGQRGMNKVSAIAEHISATLETTPQNLPLQRSNSKPSIPVVNVQNASEVCHFCSKRVYLMERHSAQGKFFHRGCFKCEYCNVSLRLGNYGMGTEGPYNGKFLCMHHFNMRIIPCKRASAERGNEAKRNARVTPTQLSPVSPFETLSGSNLDVPDLGASKIRGITPERVEFENTLDLTSEEELLSEIDEDDWTERNFGTSAAENDSSEEESDFSSDEIKEEEIEEALQHSLSSDQTLQLAESWKRRHFRHKGNDMDFDELDSDEEFDESDDDISYEEYENEDDESTATEGEVQDGAGEYPSESIISPSDEFAKDGDVQLKVPQQTDSNRDSVDYEMLKSNEESGSGEDSDSKTSDSELFSGSDTETESDTEDGNQDEGEQGIEGDKESDAEENGFHICRNRNRKRRHFIPTIVIDEMTSNAINEDDDSYFTTLQEQNLKAEKTLGDLIHDQYEQITESALQTPETPLGPCFVQDEIRPLVSTGNRSNFDVVPTIEMHSLPMDGDHVEGAALPTTANTNKAFMTSDCVAISKSDSNSNDITIEQKPLFMDSRDTHIILKNEPMDVKSTSFRNLSENDNSSTLCQKNALVERITSVTGKSQRPNSFVESLKTMEQIDKILITESDAATEESEADEHAFMDMDMEINVGLPEQKKSQEIFSSLPDLVKVKENDNEICTTGNSATESPTLKMMLKLKERYLLGNSTSPEPSFSVVTPSVNTRNTPSMLEPVVKSFLEVISEKQKMLSPALTPSPYSPSSLISSSSEPSNMQGSSSWSRFSPVSPLGLYSTSGSLSPSGDSKSIDISSEEQECKEEMPSICRTGMVPDSDVVHVVASTTAHSTEISPASKNERMEEQALGVVSAAEEEKYTGDDKLILNEESGNNAPLLQDIGAEASISATADNLTTNRKCSTDVCHVDEDAESKLETLLEPPPSCPFSSEVVDIGSLVTDDKGMKQQGEPSVQVAINQDVNQIEGGAICEDAQQYTESIKNAENGNDLPVSNDPHTNVESIQGGSSEDVPFDESIFDNIDTKFITFRDKTKRENRDSSLTNNDDNALSFMENDNDKSGKVDNEKYDSVHECAPSDKCSEPTPLDNNLCSGNVPSMPQPTGTAKMQDDSKLKSIISNVQMLQPPNIVNNNQPLLTIEREDESLKNEEEDLMGMLSSSISSDSDTTPSLDESIYTTPQVVTKPVPKQLSYLGHFAEHSFPFGGVRDSIDIRKSAMKKGPATIITTQNGSYILDNGNYDNKQLLGVIPTLQSAIEIKPQESLTFKKPKDIKHGEIVDEIPFADDESSQESSERTQKKEESSTPRATYKRSLQRPLSMIETRSSSCSPLLAMTSVALPDTPLTNPEIFATPGTMVEAIEDLRQMRTVEREKARQLARERARLKSDEELGLRAVDYKKIRKKYQKTDSGASYDIQEEKMKIEEASIEGGLMLCSNQSDNIEMSLLPDSAESSEKLVFPDSKASSPQSSSPDSEVFESSSPLISPGDVEKTSLSPTSEGSVLVPKSSSIGSIVTASFSEANKDSDPTSGSASLTSKTDCAAYLEPELSIEEVDLKISTDSNQKSTSSGSSIANSPTKIKSSSLPGLMSRKEKSKNQKADNGGVDKSDKSKPKERKSLLSIFVNFGRSDSLKSKAKEKEDKEKKKEKSGNSSLTPTAAAEISQAAAISPLEGAGLKVDGTPKESRFPKLRLARSKEKAKEKRKQKYLAHSEKDNYQSSPKDVPLASSETTPSSKETTPSSKDSTPSPKDATSPPKEIAWATKSTSSYQVVTPPKDIASSSVVNVSPPRVESGLQSTYAGLISAAELTFDRHALIASLASISKQIPSENRHGNGVAPQASDSFSDPEEDNMEEKSHESSTCSSRKSKAMSEERKRKYERIAQRMYRQQEQKRLRTAQEIQRQLEELEVKQRELETRGVQVEKALRGEGEGQDARKEEPELMEEWFHLVHSKNVLVRKEQELMVKAKELELEDRHSRLQHQLHQRMAVDDSTKTPEEIDEEGRILTEMLEIVDQRDTLIALLEENRQTYQEQDRDLELSLQAKGLRFSSASKS